MQILELGEVQLYRELHGIPQEILKVAIKLIKVTLHIMYCTTASRQKAGKTQCFSHSVCTKLEFRKLVTGF